MEDCRNSSDESTLNLSRLWNLACKPLDHEIIEKHLFLRRHDYNFLKGTIAQYECEAGYGFKNETLVSVNLGY